MQTFKELYKAVQEKKEIVWLDPCQIRGNDYTISFVEQLSENEQDFYSPILIQYGNGSEAQVFLSEIKYKTQ